MPALRKWLQPRPVVTLISSVCFANCICSSFMDKPGQHCQANKSWIFPGLMHQWHICQHRPRSDIPAASSGWWWCRALMTRFAEPAKLSGKSIRKISFWSADWAHSIWKSLVAKEIWGPGMSLSGPSLAIITPKSSFLYPSPPPLLSLWIQCVSDGGGKKKQQPFSDFLDDSSISLWTEDKGSKWHRKLFTQTSPCMAPRNPCGLCDSSHSPVTVSSKMAERRGEVHHRTLWRSTWVWAFRGLLCTSEREGDLPNISWLCHLFILPSLPSCFL